MCSGFGRELRNGFCIVSRVIFAQSCGKVERNQKNHEKKGLQKFLFECRMSVVDDTKQTATKTKQKESQ